MNSLILAGSHYRNVFAGTDISVSIKINSQRSPRNKNFKTVAMQGIVKKNKPREKRKPSTLPAKLTVEYLGRDRNIGNPGRWAITKKRKTSRARKFYTERLW